MEFHDFKKYEDQDSFCQNTDFQTNVNEAEGFMTIWNLNNFMLSRSEEIHFPWLFVGK